MNNLRAISISAAMAAAILPASLPAAVQAGGAIVVRTGDLDLTSAAGQKKLKLRLMHAVSESCPIGAQCRAPALARAYKMADALIESAKSGSAVPDALRVSAR